MAEYMQNFLPTYMQKYLHRTVTVDYAGFATAVPRMPWVDWIREDLRSQLTWGYDSMIIILDTPYKEVSRDAMVAGENYYRLDPNLGWTTLYNWSDMEKVMAIYPESHWLRQPWYAMMIGDPSQPGVNGLGTVGHEILHYPLLEMGGPDLSSQIDGGSLSGAVLLDEGLNPVSNPEFTPPNWKYFVQRVCSGQPCHMPMGGYNC